MKFATAVWLSVVLCAIAVAGSPTARFDGQVYRPDAALCANLDATQLTALFISGGPLQSDPERCRWRQGKTTLTVSASRHSRDIGGEVPPTARLQRPTIVEQRLSDLCYHSHDLAHVSAACEELVSGEGRIQVGGELPARPVGLAVPWPSAGASAVKRCGSGKCATVYRAADSLLLRLTLSAPERLSEIQFSQLQQVAAQLAGTELPGQSATANRQTGPAHIELLRFVPPAAGLLIADADGRNERKLLPGDHLDYSPSYSADGQWIVFTSERNGSADLYRVHPDGSALERLTDSPAFDDQGALSPDGSELAFVSTRGDGTTDIWVTNLSTRQTRNLTHAPGGDFHPCWSPDGRWIAFSSDRGMSIRRATAAHFEQLQAAAVYIIRPDGTDLRRMSPPDVYAGSPHWSADGKQLLTYQSTPLDAFDSRMNSVGVPFQEQEFKPVSRIVATDVVSREARALAQGPGFNVAPQSVGAHTWFVVKEGAAPGLANAEQGLVVPGGYRDVTWSPDGKQIVYRRPANPVPSRQATLFSLNPQAFELSTIGLAMPAYARSGRLVANNLTQVVLPNADGSISRTLSEGLNGTAFSATWSPDEQWIAFGLGTYFVGGTKPAQIVMMHPDGTGFRQLTQGDINSGYPSFAPDGRRLVFRQWGAQPLGLRILDLDSGHISPLTSGHDSFPAWSPRGDLIEFTREVDGNYDIYTVRPDGTVPARLTDAPGNDAHGAWSPDGTRILFSSARLGFKDESGLYDSNFQPYAELFVMAVDGTGQRALTDNQWEDGTPAWRPRLAKTREAR